jgi:hypothetical protein
VLAEQSHNDVSAETTINLGGTYIHVRFGAGERAGRHDLAPLRRGRHDLVPEIVHRQLCATLCGASGSARANRGVTRVLTPNRDGTPPLA